MATPKLQYLCFDYTPEADGIDICLTEKEAKEYQFYIVVDVSKQPNNSKCLGKVKL
jgi:hypothetical protein